MRIFILYSMNHGKRGSKKKDNSFRQMQLARIKGLKIIDVLSCKKVCVKKLMIHMCVCLTRQYSIWLDVLLFFRKIFAESVYRSTGGSHSSVFDLVCMYQLLAGF